jgi:hypothetical protein
VLDEKQDLERTFNQIQMNEMSRLNQLEVKFIEISEQYMRAKEELTELRRSD